MDGGCGNLIGAMLAEAIGVHGVGQISQRGVVAGSGGVGIGEGSLTGAGNDWFGVHHVGIGHTNRAEIDINRGFITPVQIHRMEHVA